MNKPVPDWCGLYANYARGCRCAKCREANARRQAGYRKPDVEQEMSTIHLEWQRATDLQWMIDAECYGKPTRWWFAGDGRNFKSKTAQRAISICDRCTVQAQCLEYALSFPTPWMGIFGGMTPQQRQQEKKRREHDKKN